MYLVYACAFVLAEVVNVLAVFLSGRIRKRLFALIVVRQSRERVSDQCLRPFAVVIAVSGSNRVAAIFL